MSNLNVLPYLCLTYILRSEGYVENYQLHAAAAISQAAQASVKKAPRRISVGFQKGKGIRVSVEDLRQRKTRIVCLGSENVGKSGKKCSYYSLTFHSMMFSCLLLYILTLLLIFII